ncbi:hypothetical protein LIER_04945 [Lithospermum erythrorhizon]|uniref:Uncharacterized protein n=1 Tax=Lithospermum erythrorhizon TaxID=34254 RepID=A0AAV3NYM4_LITER
MTMFKKLIVLNVVKRAPLIIQENNGISSVVCSLSSCHIAQKPRFYRAKRDVKSNDTETDEWLEMPKDAEHQAQGVLLEYLHSTRSLPFLEAECMSKNSRCFLMKLVRRVGEKREGGDGDIGSSLARFLRYHPINEFEPFFESMGLKHCEYCDFLPRNLMFLTDDPALLENCHVLCDYGVPRNRLGRIYKEVAEVFRYDSGVLQSKLIDYEKIGLSKSTVLKIVSSSPYVLIRDGKKEFLKFCEVLKGFGIECDWIGEHVKEGSSYLWSHMLELLSLLSKIGCSDEDQEHLICRHPDIIFKDSGYVAFSLIGFVLKFGASSHEMCTLFMHFPDIPVEEFIQNMRNCYRFLVEIDMDVQEIGLIVCLYPEVLGSCRLKKLNSLLQNLCIGKKRLCKVIKNDPTVLKNWVYGVRVGKLLHEEDERSQMLKTRFLSGLGFAEDSSEMNRALKLFRGNGLELQERFDCLVHAGLSAENAAQVVRMCPPILNQSKVVINKKIDHIVNELSYPVSCLIKYPSFLNYTIRRVHCRLSMYNWLKDHGRVLPNLALSSLLSISETTFKKRYVSNHPGGPEHWEKLKKDIYPT